MAIELITGRAGVPHVSSADQGAFNAEVVGPGIYIMSGCECTMQDANTALLSVGEICAQGRHVRVKGAETIQIASGSASYKRNDIIALHYTRTEDGIEPDPQVVVIQGTPVTENPQDPQMPNSGNVLDNADDAYWPLYRIAIDGLAPQNPVMVTDSIKNTASTPSWVIYEEPDGSANKTFNGGKSPSWTSTNWTYIDSPSNAGLTDADEFTSNYFTTKLGTTYKPTSNNSLITIVKPGMYRFSASHFCSSSSGRVGVSIRRNNGQILENMALSSNMLVSAFGESIVRCEAGDEVGVAFYVETNAASFQQYLWRSYKYFNIQYLGE